MARIQCITDHRTFPAGWHPALTEELVLPIRQVVEVPDAALEALVATDGICVLPELEPETETEPEPHSPALAEEPEPQIHDAIPAEPDFQEN